MREYHQKWYAENKEKSLAHTKLWRIENREKARKNVNDYYRRRKEREPLRNHERYLRRKANLTPEQREKRNAYQREWRHNKNNRQLDEENS